MEPPAIHRAAAALWIAGGSIYMVSEEQNELQFPEDCISSISVFHSEGKYKTDWESQDSLCSLCSVLPPALAYSIRVRTLVSETLSLISFDL